MPFNMMAVQLEHVSFFYVDGMVLEDINLSIEKGEMVGLIGPNGSGKTTLLKLISGVLSPRQGRIRLDGMDIGRLNRKEIARRVAVVPQQFHMPFAFTAKEVVMLGRIPFFRMLSEETQRDRTIVSQAMEATQAKGLEQRRFDELSRGEQQKVILAMALAQQPNLLLLDEPTAHLDINHQVEILELVRNLNQEKGITVVSAMHDLNLASLYFQRLVLLKEGRIFSDGGPSQVLTPDTIQEVFSASVKVEKHPSGVPYIIILPNYKDVGLPLSKHIQS